MNGDGYADVIVGANQYGATDAGAAMVWHGSGSGVNGGTAGTPANAARTISGPAAGAHLGRSVATAGDVNGDGYADVIVGAPHYTNGQTEEGAAYVYLGSATGVAASWDNADEGNQAGAWFGQSVACAGDVNGDGYADVVVGAPLYTNGQSEEGRPSCGMARLGGISTTRDWWAEGNAAEAWYGSAVATAGDVNGDGYSDLIVGAYGAASQAGSVYVYHGGPDMPSTTANWTKRSNQEDAYFGWSVGTAGDVNGDGYADIIVGAPLWDSGQDRTKAGPGSTVAARVGWPPRPTSTSRATRRAPSSATRWAPRATSTATAIRTSSSARRYGTTGRPRRGVRGSTTARARAWSRRPRGGRTATRWGPSSATRWRRRAT